MPDRVPEPLEELVRRAGLLKKTLREDADTAEFMGMLRETVGMNERIRAERAWDPAGGEVRLPMVERYSHSLMSGRLLFTVPDHVKRDWCVPCPRWTDTRAVPYAGWSGWRKAA